jgi:hypothetical protein
MQLTAVYGLFDPRDPYTIWYVGKGLAVRAAHHWKEFLRYDTAENDKEYQWLKKLRADSIIPGWRFLEENVADWRRVERRWITYWRFENPNLCNVANGGNQPYLSAERRREVSQRACKIIHDAAHRADPAYHEAKVRAGSPTSAETDGRKSNGAKALQAKWGGTEEQKNWARNGGLAGGVKSMSVLNARPIEERRKWASDAGFIGGHKRWHEARGIINPNCGLCQGRTS